MWTPFNGNKETVSPRTKWLEIGTIYQCSMKCPDAYLHFQYKLRVMAEADFTSGDPASAAKHVLLAPATLAADGMLSGSFTPAADWPAKVRVGFVDAGGTHFGLGGSESHDVG